MIGGGYNRPKLPGVQRAQDPAFVDTLGDLRLPCARGNPDTSRCRFKGVCNLQKPPDLVVFFPFRRVLDRHFHPHYHLGAQLIEDRAHSLRFQVVRVQKALVLIPSGYRASVDAGINAQKLNCCETFQLMISNSVGPR